MAESVKVAVRVRPFNSREKERNAKLIIGMSGNSTTIKDPDEPDQEPRKYAFDYSYWSHDCYNEDPETGYLSDSGTGKYTDQAKVFDDLGRDVLKNAWLGYNCSLFAYGQTGSGKSYSVVGYGQNKGIVPQFCDNIFREIKAKEEAPTFNKAEDEYSVQVSMIEIYNEQVKDLLNLKSYKKGGLKVRQSKDKGFEVQNLRQADVCSYAEIDALIEEGTSARTIAATNMNATSSRAHTVVTIYFKQKTWNNDTNKSMTKTAKVALVDLAGSERAESTGATGARLKEGAAINLSLSALGNVIKALAEESEGKNIIVPFRDSVLTKLLKTALSGNSKTMLVAALSPADINYDETMSTLRFADRAKSIKTKAVVNESPTDKLIRELREEIEALRKGGAKIQKGGVKVSEEDQERIDEMREQLAANEIEMKKMKQSWEENMANREAQAAARVDAERQKAEMKKTTPHFWNLNEDPVLTGMIVHFCTAREQFTSVGSGQDRDIIISGVGIQPDHASVVNTDNSEITIKPAAGSVTVNGKDVPAEGQVLSHNDRVLFSTGHLYAFHHPQDAYRQQTEQKLRQTPNFEDAQKEIAKEKGYDMNTVGKNAEDLRLMEELITLSPMVEEVNGIAQELDKKVYYELAPISGQVFGLGDGTFVFVKCTHLVDQTEFLLDKDSFEARKYKMQEMYQNYKSSGGVKAKWDVAQDTDPFYDDPKTTKIQVGTSYVHLESLAYLVNMEEELQVDNFQGMRAGVCEIDMFPIDERGKALSDTYVTDPSELLGKQMHFGIRFNKITGVNDRFFDLSVEFKIADKLYQSSPCKGDKGKFKLEFLTRVSWEAVTESQLKFLRHDGMLANIYGKQRVNSKGRTERAKVATKMLVTQYLKSERSGRRASDAKQAFSLEQLVSTESAKNNKRRASETIKLRASQCVVDINLKSNLDNKAKQLQSVIALCELAVAQKKQTLPLELVQRAANISTFTTPTRLPADKSESSGSKITGASGVSRLELALSKLCLQAQSQNKKSVPVDYLLSIQKNPGFEAPQQLPDEPVEYRDVVKTVEVIREVPVKSKVCSIM